VAGYRDGAIGASKAANQVDPVAADAAQGADRRPAAPARSRKERSLGLDGEAGRRIVEPAGEPGCQRVVGSHLDGERPLARRRGNELGIESKGDPVRTIEPGQAGLREDERIGLARVELPQARVDVSVERVELEVRAEGAEEGGPTRAVRAHATTDRQVVKGRR